jgi:hypothetical protein
VGTHQLLDIVTQQRRRAPDLALAAFVHDDAQNRVIRVAFQDLDFGGRGGAIVERDPTPPLFQLFVGNRAIDGHFIGFRMLEARVRELFREVAIVRHQDETFRIGIEATHREDVRLNRDQVAHGLLSVLRVRHVGRDDLHGLVEQNIDALFANLQARAIDANIVNIRIAPIS